MVIAGLAPNGVVTRAAQQVVAGLAAPDRVAAGATVNRDTLVRGARVDGVATRTVEGNAEARRNTGLAVIARAILRGVAIHDQGCTAVGDDDRVTRRGRRVATSMHHGNATVGSRGFQCVVDGEVVIPLPQQHLCDFDVAVGDATGKGLCSSREIIGAKGDAACEAQPGNIGAGQCITVKPGTRPHDTRVIGNAGVVAHVQGVDQRVFVHVRAGYGRQRHIGLVRQHDGGLDRAIGQGIDVAFNEQRPGDAAHHMRLDREGFQRLHGKRRLRVGRTDRDRLRREPVGGREGQRGGGCCREGVGPHRDNHVRGRRLGQAHGVGVGPRLNGARR